jgi:hypothetical protein
MGKKKSKMNPIYTSVLNGIERTGKLLETHRGDGHNLKKRKPLESLV